MPAEGRPVAEATSRLRGGRVLIELMLVAGAWLLLQAFVLPRMGVQT